MKGSHKIELLLLMGIIIVLLFQVAYSRKPIDLAQALLLFVAVVAVTHVLLFSKVLESFEVNPDTEPANAIFNKMNFFLASDNPKSFPPSGTNWTNVSPTMTIDNQYCTFSTIPHAVTDGTVATNGIPLRDIVITGPPSTKLIMDGNGNYTYFWYAKTHTIAKNTKTTLFYTKGDSINNSINIKVYYDTMTDSNGIVKLVVQHSDDIPDEAGTLYTNSSVNDPHFLNDMAPHLYMLVRDSTVNTLSLYVDDMDAPLFTGTLKAKCALTDQFMKINPDAANLQNHGWDANLYYFGIYNSALTSTDRGNLHEFINARTVLSQKPYKTLLSTYTDANKNLIKAQSCPFADKNLCTDTNKCGSITDWTQQGLLAQRANAECLKSVVAYCNVGSNVMKPECQYWSWNSNSAQIDAAKSLVSPNSTGAGGVGGAGGAGAGGVSMVTGATASTKRIADAVNQTIAAANSQNANTANTTVNVLQNILATTPNMDPGSANMLKSLISQNSVVAGATTLQNTGAGTVPTVLGSNAYTNSMLRTVGANLFNELTGGLTTFSSATTVPTQLAPLLSNSGSNVSHFIGSSSANLVDDTKYNHIMSQYRSNIVQNQQSRGLISTIASFFS